MTTSKEPSGSGHLRFSSRLALAACLLVCHTAAGCTTATPPPPTSAGVTSPGGAGSEDDSSAIDPNCQVNVHAGGPIHNYFGIPNPARTQDATNAIAQLDFADLYRLPPFRIQGPAGLVRLDAQGATTGGGRNWQVQVNGVNGHSTISHMGIGAALAGASTASRQAFVQRSARNGLVQSLNTGNSYQVTGFCN
jgi:hypothetical protein